MFVQDTFLDTLFDGLMLILYENGRFGDPFKIQRAPKWYPKSTKRCLTAKRKHRCTFEKTKCRETPSGLNLRFVYVLRCFAFSKDSDTVVKKCLFFLVVAVAPNTSRNTEQINPPKSSGRQNGTQVDQVAPNSAKRNEHGANYFFLFVWGVGVLEPIFSQIDSD